MGACGRVGGTGRRAAADDGVTSGAARVVRVEIAAEGGLRMVVKSRRRLELAGTRSLKEWVERPAQR